MDLCDTIITLSILLHITSNILVATKAFAHCLLYLHSALRCPERHAYISGNTLVPVLQLLLQQPSNYKCFRQKRKGAANIDRIAKNDSDFYPCMQVQMKHSARETNEDYDLNTNLLNA